MVKIKKEILVLFTISVSVLFLNIYYTFINYDSIPDIIVTHVDITGKPDAFGGKIHLIYAMIVNAVLLGMMFFVIRYPKYANYPFEINEHNRESAYYKTQLLLSISCIIASVVFFFMVSQALNRKEEMIYVIAYSVIVPVLTLIFFKSKSTPKIRE